MRASRRFRGDRALLGVASLIVLVFWARPGAAEVTIGLSFSIARDVGSPVVDDAWVTAQIDEANRFFGPLGTTFRWTLVKELLEPHGAMHTRKDRDALTPLTESGVVDVFVVRELEDVDEPGRMRRGVCWTGLAGKRFVVLSRIAPTMVLAHELGHFFGNPQHSTLPNNLMSYTRDGGTVFLDEVQIGRIKSLSTRLVASGRLLDVGPPRRIF